MIEDFKGIIQQILQFREERDWKQFHNPKNLAAGLAIEAAELQEVFLWKSTEESSCLSAQERQAVQDELSDIFIFLTYLSTHLELDLLKSVNQKLDKNAIKYPIDKSRGSSKKYTQL